MKRKAVLATAYGSFTLAGALYWGSLQMFLVDSGASNAVATAVYSLPWIVGVASIPSGRLADLYGYRRGIGVFAGLVAAASLLPVIIEPSIVSAALSGLLNTAAWALLSPVFYEEAMTGMGEAEGAGLLVAAGSVGWTLGSGATGVIYSLHGIAGSAATAAAVEALMLPLLWASIDGEKRRGLIEALAMLPKWPRISSLGPAFLLEVFFAAYLASYELWCITLYRILGDPRIYGASLAAAGIISAAATPLASRIGGKRGAGALSSLSAALFVFTNAAFIATRSPVLLFAAFLTPLWPFTSVFSYMYAREKWGGATGPGVVEALWSAAGAAAPLVGVLSDTVGVSAALLISCAVGAAALLLIGLAEKYYMGGGGVRLREEV